ncbi:MAG: FtsX-like permease family protein [Deferribacteraceae bacterium]|jgi:cell division transport system permease protein|nr:FtsX-like permease family protein [Deferribacteraceae bacterium]
MTNNGYMLMRGIGLFMNYLSENLLSILALTAMFSAFHLIFLSGGALRDFTEKAARFDTVRVYAKSFPDSILNKLSSAEGVEGIEKVYSQTDAKEYITSSAAFSASFEALPAEYFPSFAELKINPEYRNYDSLKKLSDELSGTVGIDSVSFGEKWIEALGRMRFSVEAALALCAAIFAAAGGIIIYHTVAVSFYRYRREVRIYAVVGGTRTFIIIPFVVVSACISLICFVFSLFIFHILSRVISSEVSAVINISFSHSSFYWIIFALLSLIISMLAGFVSSRHFLNHRLS